MITYKGWYRIVKGVGMLQTIREYSGWYLFGFIPLYVRVNIVK